MMSRTVYKGLRVEFYPDECATSLPRLTTKARTLTPPTALKSKPITNAYAILDTGSDADSNSEDGSYITEGVRVDLHNWADTAVA
jgi:hypothetical protein